LHRWQDVSEPLRYTRLGESDDYVAAREALRSAEYELMQRRERVAELRRALPVGPAVEDYVFVEAGPSTDGVDVRLSELCPDPSRALVIYHLMFGKRQGDPCPMCTMWVDGFNGVAGHVAQRAELAVVAAAKIGELSAFARGRRWDRLRLLSAGVSTFKYDLGSEDEDGNQYPRVSVFNRDGDGVPATCTPDPRSTPRTSENVASTCSVRPGTSSTSRRRVGATGTPRLATELDDAICTGAPLDTRARAE
jgi:predicted dithiol-disulfide oxidoreductase (DUF899 family)